MEYITTVLLKFISLIVGLLNNAHSTVFRIEMCAVPSHSTMALAWSATQTHSSNTQKLLCRSECGMIPKGLQLQLNQVS